MEEKMMDLLQQLVDGQEQLFAGQKQLVAEQKKTNERLDRLEGRMDCLEDHVARIDKRLDNLEQRVTKTEVLLENRVLPQLQLLAEGHTALADRLDQMDERYAKKEDVEVLRLAVQHHTEEIRTIKEAI